jgi:hypothetical protein
METVRSFGKTSGVGIIHDIDFPNLYAIAADKDASVKC